MKGLEIGAEPPAARSCWKTLYVRSIAFWHAYLCGPDVGLWWLTDNDEIAAGAIRRPSIDRLFDEAVKKYCGRSVEHALATESEVTDRRMLEFLSIPDLLAAGVLEHQRGTDAGLEDAMGKAAAVMQWMAIPGNLQKFALRLLVVDGTVHWNVYRPYIKPRSGPGNEAET